MASVKFTFIARETLFVSANPGLHKIDQSRNHGYNFSRNQWPKIKIRCENYLPIEKNQHVTPFKFIHDYQIDHDGDNFHTIWQLTCSLLKNLCWSECANIHPFSWSTFTRIKRLLILLNLPNNEQQNWSNNKGKTFAHALADQLTTHIITIHNSLANGNIIPILQKSNWTKPWKHRSLSITSWSQLQSN